MHHSITSRTCSPLDIIEGNNDAKAITYFRTFNQALALGGAKINILSLLTAPLGTGISKNCSPRLFFLSDGVCNVILENIGYTPAQAIGHFRVPPGLCFKTRVGAQPLIRKSFFVLMQKNSFSQGRLCT